MTIPHSPISWVNNFLLIFLLVQAFTRQTEVMANKAMLCNVTFYFSSIWDLYCFIIVRLIAQRAWNSVFWHKSYLVFAFLIFILNYTKITDWVHITNLKDLTFIFEFNTTVFSPTLLPDTRELIMTLDVESSLKSLK